MAHILVVDDEPAMLQLIRRVLEKDRHVISLLSDAGTTLNMNFSKYDLILLDIMMPGLDGFELCRQIRARFFSFWREFRCHIPISQHRGRNKQRKSKSTVNQADCER